MKRFILLASLLSLFLCACNSSTDTSETDGSTVGVIPSSTISSPSETVQDAQIPATDTFLIEPEIFDTLQVPDGEIEVYILNANCYNSDYPYSYQASHSYDSQSQIDTVTIVFDVEYPYAIYRYTSTPLYQYNPATNLWTLVYQDEWSDPTISATENLLGYWELYNIVNGDYKKTGFVNVLSVENGQVTLSCFFIIVPENNELNTATGTSYTYNAEFEGAYNIIASPRSLQKNEAAFIEIPYDIPDGYYTTGIDWERLNSTTISIEINPIEGLGISSWFDYPMYGIAKIYHS